MIVELLQEGRENKKTTQELLSLLRISKREFYSALRRERREGHFIISEKENGGGYWLWNGDYSELQRYDKMQRSGAIDTLQTLKPVYKELKKYRESIENGKV